MYNDKTTLLFDVLYYTNFATEWAKVTIKHVSKDSSFLRVALKCVELIHFVNQFIQTYQFKKTIHRLTRMFFLFCKDIITCIMPLTMFST